VSTAAAIGDGATADDEGRFSAEEVLSRLDEAPGPGGEVSGGHTAREEVELELNAAGDGREGDGEPRGVGRGTRTTDGGATGTGAGPTDTTGPSEGASRGAHEGREAGQSTAQLPDEEPLAVRELKAEVGGLETKTRQMLAFYYEHGPASAQSAHFAVGGDGDRTHAYARNRTLRTRGLVSHIGCGRYEYHLREHLEEELGDRVDDGVIEAYATDIEQTALDVDS
jgi:hypothetical protein